MALDKAKTLKAAEKFVAAGKIQQAIDEYSKILKENQRDWNLMIQVGDLFLKINKTSEAVQHFQKVADHYYLDGFYLKAIAIYKRINKLDPNLTDICIKLADLYLKQGLTMDAKSQLQVVAQHYLSKNQNKDAIVTLKKLIEIEPENLRTRNELAKAYKNEGMTTEAIKEYIEISDELLRKNLSKESLTVLETAYKMDPANAAVLRKILATYRDQNEQDKATAMLEESLRTDPKNPDVLALLAESLADEGEYSRAHETIEQAIFHTGNKEPFWILKGNLYLKEGDLDRAYETFEPAIDRQLKRKDPEKAISLLQSILGLDSSFHLALKRLTDIYGSLKQTENLITTYNQLVDALISKTLYDDASNALDKLMELEPDNEQHQEKLDFVRSFLGRQSKKEKKAEPAHAEVKSQAPAQHTATEEIGSEDFDISIDIEEPEPEVKAQQANEIPVQEEVVGAVPEAEVEVVEESEIEIPGEAEIEIDEEPDTMIAKEPETAFAEESPIAIAEEPEVAIEPEPELTLEDAPENDSIPAALLQTIPSIKKIPKPTAKPAPLPPVPPSPIIVPEGPDDERDFVSEHLIEADVFTKYGLIDKAIEQLHIITGRYANSVVAHQKLKEIYVEKGERAKAVEECVIMSKIFRRQGDMDQAEDLLSEARQIDPNHPSLEKAFKEMPATTSSTDVLSEIERLAQSLRANVQPKPKKAEKRIETPPPPRMKTPAPPPRMKTPAPPPRMKTPAPPPPPPELLMQADEINIDFEQEMIPEKTPVSVLEPEKFDEVDFYIDQGLNAEASRLLNQMSEKYPDDAGVTARLRKLKDKGIEVEAVAKLVKDEKQAEKKAEAKPAIVEAPAPSLFISQSEQDEIDEELLEEDLAEEEPDTLVGEEILPEEPPMIPSLETNEINTAETLKVLPEVNEEKKESLFSDIELPEQSEAAEAEELFEPEEKQSSGEQTWDLSDLSELADHVTMVPEPEQEPTVEAAIAAEVDEDEEDEKVDHRFPPISEKEELEQPSFDELDLGSEFEGSEVAAYPMESEVDAALDAAFAGESEEDEDLEEVQESKPVLATPELFEEEEDYFDLAAELEEGLLNVQSAIQEDKPADGQNYSLEEILSDFKKGVEKQLGSEDYDTRYNLGIAYKEMGLIDEAIAEFQIASKDPKRFLECCSMLGLCFIEKGMPKLAVKWYQRGLETGGFTEEEYLGLKYEMANAYELMSEFEKALEYYQEVYGVNAGYRNVTKKVKEINDYIRSKERPT
jgi:tetratricopeptide (TPR) repeat protein